MEPIDKLYTEVLSEGNILIEVNKKGLIANNEIDEMGYSAKEYFNEFQRLSYLRLCSAKDTNNYTYTKVVIW